MRILETSRMFISYIEHVRKARATKYGGFEVAPKIMREKNQ